MHSHQGLNVEEEHSDRIVARFVKFEEVNKSVLVPLMIRKFIRGPAFTYHRRCERAVKPASTLTNQLRSLFRYVSLRLAWLDIGQRPFISSFGSKFKAEDTIFGCSRS